MFMYTDYNQHLLDNVKKIHFIGCGGSGMYPLIQILAAKGYEISGSDVLDGSIIRYEREMGVKVSLGHSADNIIGVDMVVYSAAISKDNVELCAASSYGIPTIERSVLLGYVSRLYKESICVSGTHGKTTTTSMCAHIFLAAGRDPSVMVGGVLPILGAGHRVGHGDTIIAEACEYCNSFLSFCPTVAVILNVEEDHLDFFRDLADIQHSFRSFAQLVPDRGWVVVNGDNPNALQAIQDCGRQTMRFSLRDSSADCRADHIFWNKGLPEFDIVVHGVKYAHAALNVGGSHNISNALAAACAAYVLGVPGSAVEEGLASFTGAGRRFEKKGEFHGAMVYDDYAHHPDELHALLTMAKSLGYARVVCAFQPHTYTRTATLFQRFVQELKLADVAILAEIYAAREKNDLGISSKDLADQIPGAVYCPTLDEVTAKLRELAQPGDLLLTVGAGDIYLAGEALLQ